MQRDRPARPAQRAAAAEHQGARASGAVEHRAVDARRATCTIRDSCCERLFGRRSWPAPAPAVSARMVPATSAKVSVSAIGPEDPPFDALQREERNEGGQQDRLREEDRAAHLRRRLDDRVAHATCALAVLFAACASTSSMTTTAESTMMPKSMAPIEIRLAGMPRRSSSRKAPEQRQRHDRATMSAERQLPMPRNSISTSNDQRRCPRPCSCARCAACARSARCGRSAARAGRPAAGRCG